MNDHLSPSDWKVEGSARMSDKQRRMLNAVCDCLAKQVVWHGNRLDKDGWRHMLSGTVLGWKMMPGIDRGEGAPGFIMLGGSSLSLTKTDAAEAITVALHVGDYPEEQRLKCKPVRWSDVVLLGLGFNPADFAEAA